MLEKVYVHKVGWCRLAGVSARSRRAQATKVELKLGAKTTPEDRTFEVAQPRETRAEPDMRANTPASGRAPPAYPSKRSTEQETPAPSPGTRDPVNFP